MTTLLEKAKSFSRFYRKSRVNYTVEDFELIVAWVKREVGTGQIAREIGKKQNSGSILYYIASGLREGYEQGKIEIKFK